MITRKINTKLPTGTPLPQTLVEQMANALRDAIRSGKYAIGDTLPTWKELSVASGTSLRIPREAIARLQEEGLVRSRRHIGTVVLAKESIPRMGHVIFVQPEGPDVSFYSNVRTSTLSRTIMNAGYLFSRVILPTIRPGIFNMQVLELLTRQRIALAILSEDIPDVIHLLTKANIPFISPKSTQSHCERCVFQKSFTSAIQALVNDCKTSNVRSAIQVGFRKEPHSALNAFRTAGIAASEIVLPPIPDLPRLEAIKTSALVTMTQRFIKGREPLPDLFYFTDDFVATGAITALLDGGFRFPRDVKIVSFTVNGSKPAYSKSIASVTIDPIADGKAIANSAISLLKNRPTAKVIPLSLSYLQGETLPPTTLTSF